VNAARLMRSPTDSIYELYDLTPEEITLVELGAQGGERTATAADGHHTDAGRDFVCLLRAVREPPLRERDE
jgi:hypothetical protein